MKRYRIILIIVISILLVGCGNKSEIVVNDEPVNTSKMGHKHCTRAGSLDDGEVSLNYDLYYTGEILNLLQSEEKVISANNEILETYQNAYQKIHEHYEGLEYYDAKVIRGDTTVTSSITINYDKINIKKLLEIEGEEDNIIENGKAKVNKWITLAEKFGTKCEEVK